MVCAVKVCRICSNSSLHAVLDLGVQQLTGVFPHDRKQPITSGPLRLVKCVDGPKSCGLLQLEHSYDLGEMYGANYGYRSGLNAAMVKHLHAKVQRILESHSLNAGDLVVDIGSNDSSTLQAYPANGVMLVGIDPTGEKFRNFYPPHIQLIPEFFSARTFRNALGEKRARIVTSFSMFYDLEDPVGFMREVHEILADDGIWVFEQSYMPTMLETNSYDTACHEHLEYYALKQIKWMTDRVGFVIEDVEFNDVNGGSFSVTVSKKTAGRPPRESVSAAFEREAALGLDSLATYGAFEQRVRESRSELLDFLKTARDQGMTVVALGASTKGNVLLQYCGITPDLIRAVGEVNPDKFGAFTPGTLLPILPEQDVLDMRPDYALILPWHFRKFFEGNKKFEGVRLMVPLPRLEML